MKEKQKSDSPMNPETQQDNSSPIATASGHLLASSPLVLSLLIVLLAAVVIQGVVLYTIAAGGNDGTDEKKESSKAEATAEASALVAKPDAKQNKPAPRLAPASPLGTAPLGSLLTDEFFSDDWQPFAEMARMREQMDRLFEDSFQRFRSMPGFDDDWLSTGTAAEPAIADEGEHYLVTLDLPGADESSLDIRLENDVLSISGQREEINERLDADGNLVSKSQSTSSFQQSFSLPGPTDVAGLRSDYQNGILTITVPKAESNA
jgi:HSP20 family protein